MLTKRRFPIFRGADVLIGQGFASARLLPPILPSPISSSPTDVQCPTLAIWGFFDDDVNTVALDFRVRPDATGEAFQTEKRIIEDSAILGDDDGPYYRVTLPTEDTLRYLNSAAASSVNMSADGAPAPGDSAKVYGVDLMTCADEPQLTTQFPAPSTNRPTGMEFRVPWVGNLASDLGVTADDFVATAITPLNQPVGHPATGDFITTLQTLGLTGPDTIILPTSTPRQGYAQVELTEASIAVLSDRPSRADVLVCALYACIFDPNGAPLTATVASSPQAAWYNTGAFVTVPGGWMDVGRRWSALAPGEPDTLFPGSTAVLGNAEISLQPIASHIILIPPGAIALGVKTWNFHTYEVTPNPVTQLRINIW